MLYFVRHGSTNWNQNYDKNGIRDPKMQGKSDEDVNLRREGLAGLEEAVDDAVHKANRPPDLAEQVMNK